MTMRHLGVAVLLLGVTIPATGLVSGQTYPSRPIRLVAPSAGGGSDLTARLVAQGISGVLGQAVIVDNRGGGILPAEIVSKASPDGYTLLLMGGSFYIGPLLRETPYDPVKDFAPVTWMDVAPNVLVLPLSVAANSVKDLIALAKARPGELNYGSGSTGSSNHLAAELFKAMAGVNIMRIPYKSGAPALAALIGGDVQLMFVSAPTVAPHLKLGKLRALGVTSAQPSTLLPGIPTLAGSGLPGYQSVGITGIWAPAKTPVTAINRLNQEIVRFLKTAETKEKFINAGVEVVGSSPEEFAAMIKSDITVLGKVIKDAGIKAE